MTHEMKLRRRANGSASYTSERDTLIDANAYNPADEKDSCGVGLVAQIDGTPRREIVEMAIRALKAVFHRGAVDADGKTGDGAGIRVDVPQDFFRDAVRGMGHTIAERQAGLRRPDLPAAHRSGPAGKSALDHRDRSRALRLLHLWLAPAADRHLVIGMKANATRPEIEQILFSDQLKREPAELERALYICRRRIENRARASNLDLYVCSFSSGADLQGHVPRRGHRQLLSRPEGPPLRLGGRDLSPALFDQHLPAMAAGAALPHAGAQWRDQHDLGQHQLDEEPRDQDGLGRVRRAWRRCEARDPARRIG